MVIKLLVAFVVGSLIGLIRTSYEKKGLMKPRNLKTKWDLGFISECMYSGLSATFLILLLDPTGWVRFGVLVAMGAWSPEVVFAILKQSLMNYKDKLLKQTDSLLNEPVEQKPENEKEDGA